MDKTEVTDHNLEYKGGPMRPGRSSQSRQRVRTERFKVRILPAGLLLPAGLTLFYTVQITGN